jgi:hypothetical protein
LGQELQDGLGTCSETAVVKVHFTTLETATSFMAGAEEVLGQQAVTRSLQMKCARQTRTAVAHVGLGAQAPLEFQLAVCGITFPLYLVMLTHPWLYLEMSQVAVVAVDISALG